MEGRHPGLSRNVKGTAREERGRDNERKPTCQNWGITNLQTSIKTIQYLNSSPMVLNRSKSFVSIRNIVAITLNHLK